MTDSEIVEKIQEKVAYWRRFPGNFSHVLDSIDPDIIDPSRGPARLMADDLWNTLDGMNRYRINHYALAEALVKLGWRKP